jgi:DNA invertase Pin-like site-specific DNA recombinase
MGQINTVVVYKLDRLSRKLSDGINVLTGWLDKGVRVVSVTQQLDFSGATGQLVAAVLLAVAQMEQETRRERQAVGIEAAKKKGKYKGRKPGTNKGDVSKVAELKADGLSYSQIADKLSLSRSTVIRYMKIG